MAQIRILSAAARELERLDPSVALRIVRRIRWLAENLEHVRPEALTGEFAGLFKLRAGDYRVLYEMLPNEQTIVVHFIGHRREVYRQR